MACARAPPTGGLAARQALDEDLASVLYGAVPRAYGEMPKDMGLYMRICPASPAFDRVMKVKHAHLRPKGARRAGAAAPGPTGP